MKLRSGKEYYYDTSPYSIEIDFDHASKMWRMNKLYIKEGSFKYKKKYPLLYNGYKVF